ncbi:UNVERIFIED_CONTAM: hypothetical protein FKN15_039843 [Acipenser sinensis]
MSATQQENTSKVIVEYDYEALHEDELTIRVGDIIKHVKRLEEEGWMEGDLNGKTGMFPDNFVKEIKKETEAKDDVQPIRRERGNVASLVQRMSTYGFPAGAFQPHSNHKSFKRKNVLFAGSKKRQCRVVFEYLPQNEDELELKVGDVVDINEEVEEGWWSGTMNGKSGLFPSNFVKEIEVSDDGEQNDVLDDSETNSKELPGAGPTTPTSPLLSPGVGNGAIAQPKKVRGVGFGDIFKEGSVKLKARLSSSESEERKLEKYKYGLVPGLVRMDLLSCGNAHQTEVSNIVQYVISLFIYIALQAVQAACIQCTAPAPLTFLKVKTTFTKGMFNLSAPKPEVPSADRKPPPAKPEEKGDKPIPDQKPVKPAAPLVPPKKPIPPPGKGSILLRTGSRAPKRPDKPHLPLPVAKPNGEVPSIRPKTEFEPAIIRPKESSIRPKSTPGGDSTDGDIGDKPIPDQKPVKPAAPLVPPKKPIPPPGKGSILLRTGSRAPKRPDKPHLPLPVAKPNGEVPSIRPKTEFEPAIIRPKESSIRPKSTPGGDSTDGDIDLMSFNDIASTSEKLYHPTTNRPKMPGRRLPTQFASSPSFQTPPTQSTSKPIAVHIPAHDLKPKAEGEAGSKSEIEELRAQINQILHDVELLKTEQKKEITDLRNDLNEEKEKRIVLQVNPYKV